MRLRNAANAVGAVICSMRSAAKSLVRPISPRSGARLPLRRGAVRAVLPGFHRRWKCCTPVRKSGTVYEVVSRDATSLIQLLRMSA